MDCCCSKSSIEDNGETFVCQSHNHARNRKNSQDELVLKNFFMEKSRTEWLTTTLTLKCHYCKGGFLVRVRPDTTSFNCIDCEKTFDSLSFIVKLCGELEETFNYWKNDFDTKCQPDYALENMDKFYNELLQCISSENVKMVQITLTMADCCNRKQQYRRAAELNHSAIRSLLTYDQEYLHHNGDIRRLLEQIEDIKTQHVKVISDSEPFVSYLNDDAQLAKRWQSQNAGAQ